MLSSAMLHPLAVCLYEFETLFIASAARFGA